MSREVEGWPDSLEQNVIYCKRIQFDIVSWIYWWTCMNISICNRSSMVRCNCKRQVIGVAWRCLYSWLLSAAVRQVVIGYCYLSSAGGSLSGWRRAWVHTPWRYPNCRGHVPVWEDAVVGEFAESSRTRHIFCAWCCLAYLCRGVVWYLFVAAPILFYFVWLHVTDIYCTVTMVTVW